MILRIDTANLQMTCDGTTHDAWHQSRPEADRLREIREYMRRVRMQGGPEHGDWCAGAKYRGTAYGWVSDAARENRPG